MGIVICRGQEKLASFYCVNFLTKVIHIFLLVNKAFLSMFAINLSLYYMLHFIFLFKIHASAIEITTFSI